MLLLVDIGNTHTVIGAASSKTEGAGFEATFRISTDKADTADNIRAKLFPLLQLAGVPEDAVHRACIASVVPSLTISWQHAVKKSWNVDAVICNADIAHGAGLFDADYPHPSEVGADRVADAIGAVHAYGAPVIVVDFGTATNIEVINADGRFIGGVIAPGIITGADALFSNATQISATGMVAPKNVIGKCTSEAVRSGVIFGEVGRVDGLLDRIFAELGGKCPVVATGGLCHTVSRLSQNIANVRPELTLDGLRILAEALEKGER